MSDSHNLETHSTTQDVLDAFDISICRMKETYSEENSDISTVEYLSSHAPFIARAFYDGDEILEFKFYNYDYEEIDKTFQEIQDAILTSLRRMRERSDLLGGNKRYLVYYRLEAPKDDPSKLRLAIYNINESHIDDVKELPMVDVLDFF